MEIVIWQKARTLVGDLLETTRQLEQKLPETAADLAGFFDRREEIMTRLDQLKEAGEISSWTEVADAKPGIKEISAEIARMLRQMLELDEQIRRKIETSRDQSQGELTALRAKRKANRAYQGGRVSLDGIFIDSRR